MPNFMLDNLQKALVEALQDEYKARATYRLVISKFGEIRPFINIIESEERHIQALLSFTCFSTLYRAIYLRRSFAKAE